VLDILILDLEIAYCLGFSTFSEIYKLILCAYFLCRDLILIRAGDFSEKQYLKKDTTGL